MEKDFYKILGVDENASQADIKTVYKNLAKKYHPDKNQGNKEAEEKFKEISEAYETIGDDVKRKQYDASRRMRSSFGNGFSSFKWDNDPFDDFGRESFIFGRGSRVPLDVMVRLTITFEEMVTGVNKTISYSITDLQANKSENKTAEVTIEKGIESGTNIIFRGLGNKFGNRSGNLIVMINVLPHKLFQRDGCNVFYEYPLTLSELFHSETISVPTPKDGLVKIKIPKINTTSGSRVRIPQRGLPVFNINGLYGDVELFITIEIPDNLNENQKKKLDDFLNSIEKENYPISNKFKNIAGINDEQNVKN